MPIDASIYQQIKPFEMPSYADSQAKAMTLSSMGLQQKQAMQQMDRAEKKGAIEDKDSAYADHTRKRSLLGNALESLASLTPEQRAIEYPKARQSLIQSGVMGEQDAPEAPDEGFFNQALTDYRQSEEYQKRQHLMATTRKANAEADAAVPDAQMERALKAAQIRHYNADSAKAVAGLNPSKDQRVAALNTSDKARYDNVNMLNKGINDMAAALKSGQSRYSSPWSDNDFTAALTRAAEAFGRMQSGGAINKDEEKRFLGMARAAFDDTKQQHGKLDNFKQLARERLKTLGFNPDAEADFAALDWKSVKGAKGVSAGSGEIISSAAAAEAPTGVRMMGPDGKVRIVPENMVGEAIAAGGKKVK